MHIVDIPTNTVGYISAKINENGSVYFRGIAADWKDETSVVYIWDGERWADMGAKVSDFTSGSKIDPISLLGEDPGTVWKVTF